MLLLSWTLGKGRRTREAAAELTGDRDGSSAAPPVCAEFYVRFLPRKAVRKISIVFDIFRLARQNLSVCAGRELLVELRRTFKLCK